MVDHLQHPHEPAGNQVRQLTTRHEPRALRTYTPSQAVIERSSGIFHWTADGRRLYDFTSGVLVANLGHNPAEWHDRLRRYLSWPDLGGTKQSRNGYFEALPLSAYNAITPVEAEASRRLVELLRAQPGGGRMEQVLWAASGSEAVQKALWAALARDRARDLMLATRYGFHGKKGLAGATTGCETDPERDPRVRFISFPREECRDVSCRGQPFDPLPCQRELESLRSQYGRRLAALITEPYLGGGGSFHPPKEYLQLLQAFCRRHDLMFILDEVQSNFGRTGRMFAFETYGLEPDVVVLGKGLANGAPGAAAVGAAELFGALDYGEASDTYSGNPLVCAAVLATLDLYQDGTVLRNARVVSSVIEQGLQLLKRIAPVKHVRGEDKGMVWGVEFDTPEAANAFVLACYRGAGGSSIHGSDGIHLLGPLAKKVVRVAPPLIITDQQAEAALELMQQIAAAMT